jgi:outer membrane protein assembly factor BamD (BamD/ComL family)
MFNFYLITLTALKKGNYIMRSIVYLIITTFIFIGCSKKSDQDYLKSAEENLKNNKVQEAISDYENFIKDNPESEKAPEALTKLASIFQNKMLKDFSSQESLERSVKIYRQIYNDYPNSKQGPTSLFMSAFILANELQKLDLAKESYILFLQKYPNHELANSAREELNNLGIPADEILKKKNTPNT